MVANVLLVAIAVVLGVVVIAPSVSFVEDTGTPTAEATVEFAERRAGPEVVPTALGQPVTVQSNGRDVATPDADDVGTETLSFDGREVANGSDDRAVGMGALRLGRDFETRIQYFDGELCEFRLGYTARSDEDVASLTETMRGEG